MPESINLPSGRYSQVSKPSGSPSAYTNRARQSVFHSHKLPIPHPNRFRAQQCPYPEFYLDFSCSGIINSKNKGVNNQSEKQQLQIHNKTMIMDLTESQALTLSCASFCGFTASSSGATLQGLVFPSMAQNHILFHSLLEASQHSFQIPAATATITHQISTGAATHSTQQQHNKKPDNEKSIIDLGNGRTDGEEVKWSFASKKMGNAQQYLLIVTTSMIDSFSQTLNIIRPPPSGAHRLLSWPASISSTSNSAAIRVFEEMTVNSLIASFVCVKGYHSILRIFRCLVMDEKMQGQGKFHSIGLAFQMFDKMMKLDSAIESDTIINRLYNVAEENGESKLIVYSSMIAGLCKNDRLDKAVAFGAAVQLMFSVDGQTDAKQ